MAILTSIPDSPAATIASALAESETTFLVFLSDSTNESIISNRVTMACDAAKMNPDGYRVLWVKDKALVSEFVSKYFPADKPNIIAVSLRYGTGELRKVQKPYTLQELPDEKAMVKAFAEATVE